MTHTGVLENVAEPKAPCADIAINGIYRFNSGRNHPHQGISVFVMRKATNRDNLFVARGVCKEDECPFPLVCCCFKGTLLVTAADLFPL